MKRAAIMAAVIMAAGACYAFELFAVRYQSPPVVTLPLDPSLKLWWEFTSNWGSNTNAVAVDSTTNGNIGKCSSLTYAPVWSNGVAYMGTNATASSIILPSSITQSTLTVMCWVRAAKTNVSSYIIDSLTGRLIFEWGGAVNANQWGLYDGVERSFGPTPSTGVWHHLAWTLDGTNKLNGYLDGRQIATNLTYSAHPIGGATRVGSRYTDGDIPFNGYLDDFRIYNRVLTNTEVTVIYNATTNTVRP